ncbi:hypothetical protein [Kocuria rhizosphaericola]|uniref:hypothetical protein n=1 Tax=Kocuria rhizosphaericola TaxID=3376284 RepID=UPI0037B3F1AD
MPNRRSGAAPRGAAWISLPWVCTDMVVFFLECLFSELGTVVRSRGPGLRVRRDGRRERVPRGRREKNSSSPKASAQRMRRDEGSKRPASSRLFCMSATVVSDHWSTVAWMSASAAAAWWATVTYGRIAAHWPSFRHSQARICSRSPTGSPRAGAGRRSR